jgi:hypothetical protein
LPLQDAFSEYWAATLLRALPACLDHHPAGPAAPKDGGSEGPGSGFSALEAVASGGGVVVLDVRALLRHLCAPHPAAATPATAPFHSSAVPVETAFIRALFAAPAASIAVCDLLRRHGPVLAARRLDRI